MVILLSPLHPLNAEEPTFPVVITISFKLLFGIAENATAGIVATDILQSSNAEEPMLVTLSGIVTLVRLLQLENA